MTNCVYGSILCISNRHSDERGDRLNIKLSLMSEKPMYEQIKDAVRQAAVNGEIADNEMLPSVRQLSADLNVSAITVKRAYSDLEREGLIYTAAGKGTFIRLPDASKAREEYTERLLADFSEKAADLLRKGVSKEKMINEINKL